MLKDRDCARQEKDRTARGVETLGRMEFWGRMAGIVRGEHKTIINRGLIFFGEISLKMSIKRIAV